MAPHCWRITSIIMDRRMVVINKYLIFIYKVQMYQISSSFECMGANNVGYCIRTVVGWICRCAWSWYLDNFIKCSRFFVITHYIGVIFVGCLYMTLASGCFFADRCILRYIWRPCKNVGDHSGWFIRIFSATAQ